MSEGEEYIADFLDSENIKYEVQARIHTLKDDLKQHRDADFYLPQYEVYIEFFGQWNLESQKPRYREKKKIYKLNKIPCVILYPENLGIIEYVFHRRLVDEFKKYNLKKALLKYRSYELWKDRGENLIFLIIGLLIFYSAYPWSVKENQSTSIVGISIVGYQLFLMYKSVKQIFTNGPKNKRIFN